MELFGEKTTREERSHRTLYLVGRLRVAKYEDLAASTTAARTRFVAAQRRATDAHEPVVIAIATRDSRDDALDEVAQSAAATLRGRTPNAAREHPYVDVVPDGLDAIIGASIEDTPSRYEELVERAHRFLPEDDPVRQQLAAVPALVEAFRADSKAVTVAQTAEAIALSEFEAAREDLDRTYERIAGTLIERRGKKGADRFFWKRSARRSEAPTE